MTRPNPLVVRLAVRRLLAVVALGGLLSACGQTGALYQPPPEPAEAATPDAEGGSLPGAA